MIEREWSLHDVDDQHRSWRRNGPPLNITALAIAAALGVDLTKKEDAGEAKAIDVDADQLTLADLAGGVPMPVAGGDTTAISAAILTKLKELQPDG